jgi:hypothetical protein
VLVCGMMSLERLMMYRLTVEDSDTGEVYTYKLSTSEADEEAYAIEHFSDDTLISMIWIEDNEL